MEFCYAINLIQFKISHKIFLNFVLTSLQTQVSNAKYQKTQKSYYDNCYLISMKFTDTCMYFIQNISATIYGLDIQNQKIPELKPNGLNIFSSIFQLGLSFNNIQKVSNGAFNGLEKVTGLYLNDNNITIIENGAIDNLIRLRNMDFSLNPIRRYI